MYLKCHKRFKDGKEHRYWSIVESVRTHRGVMKRQLLYLGEINDNQRAQWCSAIDVFDESSESFRQMCLFPEDRTPPEKIHNSIRIKLDKMTLHRPRQWGGCWLALTLWDQLRLDSFWEPLLRKSRKGTRWLNVLKTLVCYRLIDPGSEWRLHRDWFKNSALGDLLGEDDSIAGKNTLYRCLDKLCAHKMALFSFLDQPWKKVQDLVEVKLARDDEDLYVLTRSGGRRDKEQSMRRRRLKKLWKRLQRIREMKKLKRDDLLLKLGSARKEAGNAWRLVDIKLPEPVSV